MKTYKRIWTGRKWKRVLHRPIDGGKISHDTWARLDTGNVKSFLETIFARP